MDLMKHVTPSWSLDVCYHNDYNKRLSCVRGDFFDLGEVLLVVGTELDANPGPSITNSVEHFARKVVDMFPDYRQYQFMECYRWPGQPPTFDDVFFDTQNYDGPNWKRLDAGALHDLAEYINENQTQPHTHADRPDVQT